MVGELTKDESRELIQHESVIERGRQAFLDVGNALQAIRDGKLYRGTHKTFEAYCDDRFGFTRQTAHNYIQASRFVNHGLQKLDESELPKKERHIREVLKAPEEKQAEVVQIANEKAWAEDREPTAKDYREAVERLIYAEPETVEAAEVVEYEDDADPPELEPLWYTNRSEVEYFKKELGIFKKDLKAASDMPGTELLVKNRNRIMLDISNIQAAISASIPYDRCPYCNGLANDCTGCNDRGWVNKTDFERAPKEMRDAVARLSSGGSC